MFGLKNLIRAYASIHAENGKHPLVSDYELLTGTTNESWDILPNNRRWSPTTGYLQAQPMNPGT